MSIRVPPTTLSIASLDLGKEAVRGSQPRLPPVWLMSQGPFTMAWAVRHPFPWPHATPKTPLPASQPSPSFPTPKELVGPTGLLKPGPPLCTIVCAVISCPFISAPAWAKRSMRGGQRKAEASRTLDLLSCEPQYSQYPGEAPPSLAPTHGLPF